MKLTQLRDWNPSKLYPIQGNEEEEKMSWESTTEQKIYDIQNKLIEKFFGKEAAEAANYGWGVTTCEGYISVATKVYGHGILQSDANKGTRIVHTMKYQDKSEKVISLRGKCREKRKGEFKIILLGDDGEKTIVKI